MSIFFLIREEGSILNGEKEAIPFSFPSEYSKSLQKKHTDRNLNDWILQFQKPFNNPEIHIIKNKEIKNYERNHFLCENSMLII